MKPKLHVASAEAMIFAGGLIELIRQHSETLTTMEAMAILAQLLGKMTLLPSARVTMTEEMMMNLIMENIRRGSRSGLDPMGPVAGEA
jgi:hypothetical protein